LDGPAGNEFYLFGAFGDRRMPGACFYFLATCFLIFKSKVKKVNKWQRRKSMPEFLNNEPTRNEKRQGSFT
jgi:hypothetical protein